MFSTKKKLTILFLSGAIVLSAGSFAGYHAYANNPSKQEVLSAKTAEFEKQKADLLANPNATSEQGKQVKELGAEIGRLKTEVAPEKTEDQLNRKLSVYKEMIKIHESYYQNNPDVDLTDPKVIEVLAQIDKKKKMVERIDQEIAEGKKTVDQIFTEFEQGKAELRN
ncbi:hypothetical protein [Paenibacillus durus]|uniref:hypothetical protein n=1 Tax=Paenibacillus durus TaxID=44251 RepID=UPI0006932C36|nr:hypothetical protein [Paenibacillus durus]